MESSCCRLSYCEFSKMQYGQNVVCRKDIWKEVRDLPWHSFKDRISADGIKSVWIVKLNQGMPGRLGFQVGSSGMYNTFCTSLNPHPQLPWKQKRNGTLCSPPVCNLGSKSVQLPSIHHLFHREHVVWHQRSMDELCPVPLHPKWNPEEFLRMTWMRLHLPFP